MTKYRRMLMKDHLNGEPLWVTIVELSAIVALILVILGLFK